MLRQTSKYRIECDDINGKFTFTRWDGLVMGSPIGNPGRYLEMRDKFQNGREDDVNEIIDNIYELKVGEKDEAGMVA